jgi:dUTP pyrophosphatase
MTEVFFVKTDDLAKEPRKANVDDAGFDLVSIEDVSIPPMCTLMVSTGIKMAIPDGYVGMVCSRSGMAAKHSVFVINSPGIIDAGYRGEVKIILNNAGDDTFYIKKGDRIAQLVMVKLADVEMKWVEDSVFDNLSSTRGTGGFGSTGA